MFNLIWQIYTAGIVICLLVFLFTVPDIALGNAVISALLWPWGLYQHFVAT